jgi:hypothetical protein
VLPTYQLELLRAYSFFRPFSPTPQADMGNDELERLLTALLDGPRPLRELLPHAGCAELREIGEYLQGAGLVGMRFEQGEVVVSIAAAGRAFVKRARRGL